MRKVPPMVEAMVTVCTFPFSHFISSSRKPPRQRIPFYSAMFPHIGQCRQEMNGTVMALYKHFGYAGRASEIAVYLERRMGIEQIRIGPPRFVRVHQWWGGVVR